MTVVDKASNTSKNTLGLLGRSGGLVVNGGGLCLRDRAFESQHGTLVCHFSHLFVCCKIELFLIFQNRK